MGQRHGTRRPFRAHRGRRIIPDREGRLPRDLVYSVCPHDCPSTCALEVERLDERTIGRVHGRKDHPYTAGVVCAKVARYAERQHHPERLKTPLRRVGDKGIGLAAFVPIGWDEALDSVAAAFAQAAERHGAEAVWPHYYAGTMGPGWRDGIHRPRHALWYPRQHSTTCNVPSDSGLLAAGRTKRSYLRLGYGFSRSRNGAAQLFAASCLPAVTGAWQYEGGGALYANGGGFYRLDRTLIEGSDVVDHKTRILDQSRIGPILTGDRRDLGDGPPVTALLVQNTNPMVVSPESNKVRAGFARGDLFTCVHEQFMTETAAMADVVLPATTFLEHDDIYTAGGHTFLQVARKVVEPFAEARANHYVICELAKRLGAEHPGFGMSEWEIIDRTLPASRLPDAATIYAKSGHDMALPFERAHFLDGFGHADKRFHFRANWAAIGPNHAALPALPDHVAVIDRTDAAHPFRMVAPPARSFLNTTFNNMPSGVAREGRPTVRVHPADLAALDVADGARLRLGNNRGSVVLHARAFDGMQRGVVVVEGIWPNPAFAEGIRINALVSAHAGLPNGGAVFHDTAVWVRAA